MKSYNIMCSIPPAIQNFIDQGYGYIDMDGGIVFHEWCREACCEALRKMSRGISATFNPQINVLGNMYVQNLYEYNY